MKIKIVKPTGEVESHDAGIEASFEPFENERESNEPEAVEKQIEATEKEIERRLEKAKENSEATKGEDHVGDEGKSLEESFNSGATVYEVAKDGLPEVGREFIAYLSGHRDYEICKRLEKSKMETRPGAEGYISPDGEFYNSAHGWIYPITYDSYVYIDEIGLKSGNVSNAETTEFEAMKQKSLDTFIEVFGDELGKRLHNAFSTKRSNGKFTVRLPFDSGFNGYDEKADINYYSVCGNSGKEYDKFVNQLVNNGFSRNEALKVLDIISKYEWRSEFANDAFREKRSDIEKYIKGTNESPEENNEDVTDSKVADDKTKTVGEEITESFKNRKDLSSRIQSLKAEGIAFKVNRSATEGMRYDLTYAKPIVEGEGDAIEVTDEVNVEEPIEPVEAKHVGADEIESAVREIASKYNGEGSEAQIGVDEFSKEGEGDKHIKLTVLGGLNGFGEWDRYLTALGSFLSEIKEETGWNPRVEELASDIADDTFSVTLHLYDEELDGSIEESIGKLKEWYEGRKAEAEIGESVEEGAEGKRVEGKEYVIFDASEEGKAPILDIRSTRVEAESRANELKKTGEYDSVSFDEAPKGRFHKGDDFWGPFEGDDWHLAEEKRELKEGEKHEEGNDNLFGYVNGDLADFKAEELIDKVKERKQSLHTVRYIKDTDDVKTVAYIFCSPMGFGEEPAVFVDVVEDTWTRNPGDADDINSYYGTNKQERIKLDCAGSCGEGEEGFAKAIEVLNKYRDERLKKKEDIEEKTEMKEEKKEIEEIADFHFEWRDDEDEHLVVVATFPDGHEEDVGSYESETEKPEFLKAQENGDELAFENYDYEDWYDDALDKLHSIGLYLTGELESKHVTKWKKPVKEEKKIEEAWKKVVSNHGLRDAIDAEDYDGIRKAAIAILKDVEEFLGDNTETMDLIDQFESIEEDEEDFDYALDELYDLCDNVGVFIRLDAEEALKEGEGKECHEGECKGKECAESKCDESKCNEGWFRGCEGVEFIWHGTQSDPELEYKGQRFNYWEIEDALWDMFKDDGGDTKDEEAFNKFVQEYCKGYLDDVIASQEESLKEGECPDEKAIEVAKYNYGLDDDEAKEFVSTLSDEGKCELIKGWEAEAKKSFHEEAEGEFPILRGTMDFMELKAKLSDDELKYMESELKDYLTSDPEDYDERHGVEAKGYPDVVVWYEGGYDTDDIIELVHEAYAPSERNVEEDLKIIGDISDYEPWSGAVDLWNEIQDKGLVDQLDMLLDEVYPEGITMTQLNDILWFEQDWVREMLGIEEEPEGEEEEE